MRSFILYLAVLLTCGSYVLAAPTPKKFSAKQSNGMLASGSIPIVAKQAQVVSVRGGRGKLRTKVTTQTEVDTDAADILGDLDVRGINKRLVEVVNSARQSEIGPILLDVTVDLGDVSLTSPGSGKVKRTPQFPIPDDIEIELERESNRGTGQTSTELEVELENKPETTPPSTTPGGTKPAEPRVGKIVGLKGTAAIKQKDGQSQSVKAAVHGPRVKGGFRTKHKQKVNQSIEIEKK
ncbi:hypothetical protein TWF281_011834 [Arthrobotrys megalospora]